ncbi:RNA polymerase sigma factor [Streptomyces sp. Isolate_219]|uniref:RNA polymerase sigma factor n=1 Tax=Streptomyces sp. Isolate_219 TaxID=2950110 RepID=UPI0021CA3B75|nr:sigma-70 region 4 domain-containing protein [Streptomyces sp. Isolate_219]MCR8574711.1 sigma-70 region 4 domain-containing protein [Streptomyces sp. Isolate_219]
MDYQLTITTPGQQPIHRTIAGDTLAELAAAVHHHVRGALGGQVDVRIDGAAGTVHRGNALAAQFTLTLITNTPAPHAEPGAIRGGWTLSTLDQLARQVVANNRSWWPAGDRDDQYAAAWHGIVEHLYSASETPSRTDLMEAGRQALAEDVKATMRHHGARRDTSNTGQKYAMYWEWAGRATPSPEASIVERTALWQILASLTPRQREAFDALAAAGDYPEAARLLAIEDQTFRSLLGRARGTFRQLWHEGETPSQHWGCDRRAGTVRGTVGNGSAIARLRRRARTAARKAA